jgi:hypothetical protein
LLEAVSRSVNFLVFLIAVSEHAQGHAFARIVISRYQRQRRDKLLLRNAIVADIFGVEPVYHQSVPPKVRLGTRSGYRRRSSEIRQKRKN